MNINTRQLHAFTLVCVHRSFTKAAEHMYITQSGLSALIRELETQLDFRLFERTTRSVMLTEAGERFYSVAQEVHQNLESNIKYISRMVAGQQRSLRIAASPIMVSGILPEVLQYHLGQYPDDVIELLDVSRSEVLPEVEKGEADLGLGIFFRTISGIRLHRLFSSSLMLISPQDFSLPKTTPKMATIKPATIASLPLIRLQQSNPFQQWVDDRLLAEGGMTPEISRGIRFRNIESCVAMVEMGNGHFVAPDFVAPICKRYKVRSRRILLDNAGVDFYAIARTGTELGPVAPDFIKSFLSVVMDKRIGEKYASGVAEMPVS